MALEGRLGYGAHPLAHRSETTDMPRNAATCSLLLWSTLLGCALVQAKGLDSTEQRIVRAADARQTQSLELLAEVVNIPSATENHAGVRKVGDVFARELAALGFETRWVDQRAQVGRSGHLVAVHRGTRGKRLLLIGHLDTVLEGEPFRRDGNRAYGTGIADMKGGNVIIVEALRALHSLGALKDRQVIVVFTGDEEDPG
jgi:glutamate carboxypeptidase